MSSYWDDKWSKAKDNWEELQSKRDSSDEILAGLKSSPGGLGRGRPSQEKHILDAGFNNGRSVTVTATGLNTEVNTTPLAELKGDDEVARSVALTLQTETIKAIAISDIFAKVEWGSGGFQSQAEVDILRGAVLNLNCSWLRVTAALEGQIGDVVKFGAFAAYGNRAAGANPNQRTIHRDIGGVSLPTLAPATASGQIRIPDFANKVQLAAGTPIGAADNTSYSLRFTDGAGGVFHEAWFIRGAASNSGYKSGIPVPWASPATHVQIINREAGGGQDLVSPKLIFELSI